MNYFEPILKIMEKRKISAYKIEKDLNIKQTTISGWKEGKKIPLEKAIEILRYLGVSADELYDLSVPSLSKEEQTLIEAYRKASKLGKQTIQELAHFESTRGNLSDSRPNEAGEKIG